MSKKSGDQKPTREPMAIPVPDEELSIEELRFIVRLQRSKEYIDGLARAYDAVARGLIPGASLPLTPPIDTLKHALAPRKLKLLQWLERRPVSVTVREGATFSARCVPDRNRWGSAKWHPLGWLGSRMDRL